MDAATRGVESAVVDRDRSEEKGATTGGVAVSLFDHSVESFFSAMNSISALCGAPVDSGFDPSEIERFSSMITFLKEWRNFTYDPKVVRFARDNQTTQTRDVSGEITLPQYSSVAVPELIRLFCGSDFVFHAGGHVSALDWCPRIQDKPDTNISCEYLAVAAHPPSSTHHKIGSPLVGRGAIQIWCLLNLNEIVKPYSTVPKSGARPKKEQVGDVEQDTINTMKVLTTPRPRGRPRKRPIQNPSSGEGGSSLPRPRGRPPKRPILAFDDSKEPPLKRPRGRPRKYPTSIIDDVSSKVEYSLCNKLQAVCVEDSILPLSVDSSEVASGFHALADINCEKSTQKRPKGRPRKKSHSGRKHTSVIRSTSNDCSINQIENVNEAVLSLRVASSDALLARPDGIDATCKEELTQRRGRGRPRKKPLSSGDSSLIASGVKAEKAMGMLPTSSGHGALTENSLLDQCQTGHASAAEVFEGSTRRTLFIKPGENRSTKEETMEYNSRTINEDGFQDKTLLGVSENELPVEIISVSSQIAAPVISLTNDDKLIACTQKPRIKEKEIEASCKNSGYPASSANDADNKFSMEVVPTPDNDCKLLSNEVSQDLPNQINMSSSIPKDIASPRIVLCLGHNGRVAWDVKWRPCQGNSLAGKTHMGYLAVLLGNGILEVWEVPLPGMVQYLYSYAQSEGTDPRFVKLEPIFRSSTVKCGDRQSIPLAVEWSSSLPHDLLLAGCHDGVVALWKFSSHSSSQESKPLVCFTADSVPIRALSWVPYGSDGENPNLFVTAGHEGVKFWDVRDPFRPLWDLNPAQRAVLSLDWIKDLRCLVISFDDGTMRILSLPKAANDIPVTGSPFAGTKCQGLHGFTCSAFAIWSVQVSQTTGVVAYCSADGSVVRFQLRANYVKDPNRNRVPYFLCGSLTEEGHVLNINSSLPNIPLRNVPVSLKKVPGHGYLFDAGRPKEANSTDLGDNRAMVKKFNNSQAPPVKRSNSKLRKSGKNESEFINDAKEQEKTSRNFEEGCFQEYDVLPPKIVAMQRVRWNMNKGSERWLCFGGAAGIIRCQKIPLSTYYNNRKLT
ncbi:General transcription factor 3C polypeptide 2 [Ananas comosus]|uniref:General transcription factor 3C polypeptide 2 n=1 Tax=Ananas comosus TaxID=4615 RepID=A0A199VD61_ANACO|nr:General transcription factor 3C polypeptide 2 [Ananas comosus]